MPNLLGVQILKKCPQFSVDDAEEENGCPYQHTHTHTHTDKTVLHTVHNATLQQQQQNLRTWPKSWLKWRHAHRVVHSYDTDTGASLLPPPQPMSFHNHWRIYGWAVWLQLPPSPQIITWKIPRCSTVRLNISKRLSEHQTHVRNCAIFTL